MEQLALNYSPKNRLNLISYKINNTKKRQEKKKKEKKHKKMLSNNRSYPGELAK